MHGTWHESLAGGEVVRAFVSATLGPVPPLELTPARQRLLECTLLAPSRLDAIDALLTPYPVSHDYLYSSTAVQPMLGKEQIDGFFTQGLCRRFLV